MAAVNVMCSVMSGLRNKRVNAAMSQLLDCHGCTIEGDNNVINGSGNTCTGNNNVFNGSGNTSSGNGNVFNGSGNTSSGNNNAFNGSANTSRGHNNMFKGDRNVSAGHSNTFEGSGNKSRGRDNRVLSGSDNEMLNESGTGGTNVTSFSACGAGTSSISINSGNMSVKVANGRTFINGVAVDDDSSADAIASVLKSAGGSISVSYGSTPKKPKTPAEIAAKRAKKAKKAELKADKAVRKARMAEDKAKQLGSIRSTERESRRTAELETERRREREAASSSRAAVVAAAASLVEPKEFKASTVQSGVVSDPDKGKCVVCTDAEVGVVLLPCLHMATCGSCSERLFKSASPECPLCRTRVNSCLEPKRV
jgi:hypothetical protein